MAKTGRPRIDIDWKIVDSQLYIQGTGEEIAGYLGVSYDTLERRCKEEHGLSFADYSEQKRGVGRLSLRRAGWKLAQTNAAVNIFLSKNLLGMSDRIEQTGSFNVQETSLSGVPPEKLKKIRESISRIIAE